MKNHSIILVMALIAAGGAMAMDTGTITDGTTTLNGGTIYTVSGNVEINAGATSNALTAVAKDGAGGKKVVINIPENCSLTVNGGEASGRSGAGAGILLPADMTLYVTGKGKLVASGGKAAKGGNGSNGGAASYDDTGDNHHKNGSGGSGGDGGGGAGAGIGGTGGKGDTGGKGASATDDWQYSYHGKYFPKDGSDGEKGSGGEPGTAGGTVYILGDVAATVTGGAAGEAGSAGSGWGSSTSEKATDDWHAGGGGPGGGGGGGGRAMAIGGGGGGGGAGGGGGSGSYVVVDNDNTYKASNIDGGKGGDGKGGLVGGGSGSGEPESSTEHNNYKEDTHPISKTGAGAAGNAGYAQGAGGKVVVLPTAAIACSPSCTVDSGAGLPQEQFLSVTMTLDFGLTEGGSAKQIQVAQPFACKMVTLLDEAKVKRAGYRFAGYWTDDGTCVYGPDYKATMVMSPYVEDYTLYARWEIDSSILSITSSGDGASTLDVYGNEAITLRDAVNALVANPLLVGEDGRRRVTFEKLDSTNRVIKLAGEIAIPAGARSFEVNGLCELVPGEKGVELVAGANSRHFNFKGASSDDGGMFSLANLTLTGGKGDNGGSLLLSGASISIDNCAFLGNEASNYGGAICLMAKSTNYLLVASTTFAGNSAKHGGALRLQGDGNAAFFVNTTFSGNSASGYGGAVNAINGEVVDFLACTFTGNKAGNPTSGPTLSVSTPVNAVNCIFTGNAPQFQGDTDKITTYWCSTNATPAKVFTSYGLAVTQVVAGVTHVVHPPLGGASAGNEDAAEIYYDASYDHILAVGRDGRRVLFAGDPNEAKATFVVDQLAQVRTAPTRGAVRLAVGTEPVVVELDGILSDKNGNARANYTTNATVTVIYSDAEAEATNLVIRTAEEGVFGLSVPVDGSDGLTHNVIGVKIDALGTNDIDVTMAPYAMKAASVDLIASPDYIGLEGENVSIGNVAAASISAAQSFDARSAGSFTAGTLKGFSEINLENVSISGGSLKWLGGAGPAKGVAFANLGEMSVSGGAPAGTPSSLSCGANGTVPYDVGTAANDGFFQLQAQCESPNGGQLQLDVVEGDSVAFNVTPKGTIGPDDTARKLVWTVPVRKGQKVRLTMYGGASAFELTSVKGQFIYFGVVEKKGNE